MSRDLKLEVLLQAVDKVTGPLKKITQGSGKTAAAIRASKEQIKGLDKVQKDVTSFRKMRVEMRGLDKSMAAATATQDRYSQSLEEQRAKHDAIKGNVKSARAEYKRLAKSMERTQEPTAALNRDFSLARDRLARLEVQQDRSYSSIKRYKQQIKDSGAKIKDLDRRSGGLGDRMKSVRGRLDAAGISTDKLGNRFRETRDQAARLNTTLKTQEDRLKRIARLRGAAGNARAAGGNMVSNARQTATTAGVVGGLAAAGIGGLGHSFASEGEEVSQWAARLGIATKELTRLQYAGSQYGVQNDAMIDGLKELSLRTDEFVSTGKGSGAEAFERLGLHPAELKQISGDTSELFDTVLGRLREIENVGARQRIVDEIFGGQGGEQMAEMVSASADEMARLKQQADALGVSFGDNDVQIAKDYMTAWRETGGALKGVRNILGRELAPVITGLLKQFTAWIGSNRSAVESFAQELGEGLKEALPMFVSLAKGALTFARTVGSIIQNVSVLVGGMDNLAIIAGVIFAGKALASIAVFAGSVLKLGWAFLKLAGIAPYVIAGIKAIGAAFMATPIGWIVAGIAAVATAAYLIWENWEPIKGFIADLWGGVLSVLSTVWSGIKTLFSWTPLGMIIENWGAIGDWFSGLGDGIMSGLGKALDWITSKFLAPIQAIKDTIGGAWDALFGGEDEATSKIKKAAKVARNAAGAAAIGSTAIAGPAAADIAFDSRPALSAGASSARSQQGDQNTFQIYAAPGMDEAAIARQIEAMLARRDREKASRRRSALYDTE